MRIPSLPTNRLALLWVIVPLALSPFSYAHAYLDPGAGSYFIQIVIGFIFGAAYAMRNFIRIFFAKLKNRKNKKNTKDE